MFSVFFFSCWKMYRLFLFSCLFVSWEEGRCAHGSLFRKTNVSQQSACRPEGGALVPARCGRKRTGGVIRARRCLAAHIFVVNALEAMSFQQRVLCRGMVNCHVVEALTSQNVFHHIKSALIVRERLATSPVLKMNLPFACAFPARSILLQHTCSSWGGGGGGSLDQSTRLT